MTIQDLAGNPFITASGPMIGFMPASESSSRALSLRIYRFLIEGIREEDQTRGARFVERYLEGPQAAWGRIDGTIRSLPDMWSITKCDDRFLPYLKWIVGWTSELDYITDDLDASTLRRLIAASVPFWKIRGSEDALTEILRLTTAARLRVLTWFDLRYISDETGLSEEHEDHDPWMIDLPGADARAENQMNVRIVDDGSLNRRLVRNLVRLTRPGNERVTISYLGFLDLFTTDDDSSQWAERTGPYGEGSLVFTSPVVDGGVMTLSSTTSVFANPHAASDWQNYTVSVKLRGATSVLEVYRTGDGDSYAVLIDTGLNTIGLYKFVAGAPTLINYAQTFIAATPGEGGFGGGVGSGGWDLRADEFYTLRVSLVPEAGATQITVWLDGNFALSALDATHAHGSVGLVGLYSAAAPMGVSDVELFFNPMQEDFIDIVTGAEDDDA